MRKFELVSLSEEATDLREQATDIIEALDIIYGYLSRIKELCIEVILSLFNE